jgi:putative protein-disulfide isomerase
MDGLQFIYFADPMCSWCYGFSPVLQELRARYAEVLPIRVVMGGLRPGTDAPMPAEARRSLVHHWEEIGRVAGVPFSPALAEREGFVYDTDPAARAVVLARRGGGDSAGLDYLARAHTAFYAEGRDVTDAAVLGEIAGEMGLDGDTFAGELRAEDLKEETWRDYAISQRAGVTGFPTLVVGPNRDGSFAAITRGYNDLFSVTTSIDRWLAHVRAAAE